MTEQRKTAGELQQKVVKDTTKYDAREVGHAMTDDIGIHLRTCIENHKPIINEQEFCVIMLLAEDPIIKNLVRRKFYAWPYLPSPRPNQAVFYYDRKKDDLTKRLWVLPSAMVMAELHSLSVVDPRYQTQKTWSDAFYKGWKFKKYNKDHPKYIKGKQEGEFFNSDPKQFWKLIRKQSNINMLSEHEYLLAHREELIKAGCKPITPDFSDPFDFSKIHIKNVVDTVDASVEQKSCSGTI